ncbi:MATE family efflux transporter [Thiomicrorhabdus sp. zzn3]|uniref:MATE family efflux transporter n=1 Tax=Thiomicrorhabdus sp. zzn3 TaxID=3039775 RepID=UPI002436ABF0|nr:MATE family efflux transporter [Thiomicrorhabdus sp. zzn3]MDG6778058.1 MATE family efflux transporter [Thiomicrorhabdus sp. zzn3]
MTSAAVARHEIRQLFRLALPIFLAQLALTALGVIDTIMSGWVGTDDLAAIGLGSNIMLPVFIFGTGILLALTPLVSKQYAAKQLDKLPLYLNQGMWLALPLGVFSMVLLMNLQYLLVQLELSPQVYQLTEDYLFYIAWGLPGVAFYQVLRFFWEGLGTTLPTMWISFVALMVNVPLNALFIYGFEGWVEPLGAAGCGVASALVMWLMFVLGLLYVYRSPLSRPFVALSRLGWPQWHGGMADILHIGFPNSLALLFEVSLFSFIALFIAQLGSVVIAGHQIAISFTSLAFMLPLSLAMAITVRVSRGYGAQDAAAVKLSLYVGLGIALSIGAGLSVFTFLLRDYIVALYSRDSEVLVLASALLVFAAYYQVFDAVQVAAAGALRGFHDTRVTMVVTFISYWMFGLAGGYALAYTDWFTEAPMGVAGFWLGIVLGLSLAAILLLWRLKQQYRVRMSESGGFQ